MMSAFCVVLTSVGNRDEAERLTALVLEARLAACVQIMGVESHYRWEGALRRDDECVLIMKAQKADYAALETFISRNHRYDVPEIICLDVSGGFAPYLAWVAQATRGGRD
jgi:periplasmic divalent cation tolerance protein